MQAQFKKAIASPHEYLKFAMSATDTNTWYILIENVKGKYDEFVNGQYLVRIKAPEAFPNSPPEFYFMTPNGLYDVEKKVCISIGEFHKDSYIGTLGMLGFAEQLVSGMTDVDYLGHGISILHQPSDVRKQYANESTEYNNIHYKQYMDMIYETYAGYSSLWLLPNAQPNAQPNEQTPTNTQQDAVGAVTSSMENINLGAPNAQTTAPPPQPADPRPKRKAKASSMSWAE
ncbi:hypothetical protein D5a_00066 [Faustovirus]|nr:hypothetical protein D5a_00066 [Faustovirus]